LKQYILLCLLILANTSICFSQTVQKLFSYEQREGDTRPKPNLTLRKLSGETLSVQAPSPSRIGKGESKGVRSTAGWQPNGICICDTAWGAAPSLIVSDGKHGAIVCWTEVLRGYPPDTTHNTEDIYAQRVDSGGNEIWPHQGVPVCSLSNAYSYYPAMISDGQGGAIIAWEDTRGGFGYTRVFAQRLDSLGNRLWPENGVLVCNQMSGYVDLCSDGHGGAIIVYADGRNEATTSDDIYAQRIDSAGNPAWIIDGVPVCTADSIQFWPHICSNNYGGAIIRWSVDKRNDENDAYAQLVDYSGKQNWDLNGKPICVKPGLQATTGAIANKRGGGIIEWLDYAIDSAYVQLYDSVGNTAWSPGGVKVENVGSLLFDNKGGTIIANVNNANRLDSLGNICWGSGVAFHTGYLGFSGEAKEDDSGGVIAIWDDRRTNPSYSDQYVQKADSSGNLIWNATGVAVCTLQMAYETEPQITSDGLGGALCTWYGNPLHGANQIWLQRIYANGSPGGVTGEPIQNIQSPAFSIRYYPNPFNRVTTINYQIPKTGEVTLKVYNILGQAVRELVNSQQQGGAHVVKWYGTDYKNRRLSNGIYFMHLTAGKISRTEKITILR